MNLESKFEDIEKIFFDQMESEPSEPLVHYTSSTALREILMKRELWFSDSEYMNDKSEGQYVYNIVRDALSEFDADFADEIKNQLFIQDISTIEFANQNISTNQRKLYSKYTRPKDRIFICCFSKDKDCLPMWNYYTKNPSSIGYNLVFNSGNLVSSIFPRDSFYFVPHICRVLYKPKSQYRVISKILSSYYDLWKNNIKSRHNIISRLTFLIDDIRFLFKHPAFEHESEIRIILRVSEKNFETAIKNKYVGIREAAGYFIPYIKLKCISDNTVDYITISPTNNKEGVANSLNELLRIAGIDCGIKCSNIPVRY